MPQWNFSIFIGGGRLNIACCWDVVSLSRFLDLSTDPGLIMLPLISDPYSEWAITSISFLFLLKNRLWWLNLLHFHSVDQSPLNRLSRAYPKLLYPVEILDKLRSSCPKTSFCFCVRIKIAIKNVISYMRRCIRPGVRSNSFESQIKSHTGISIMPPAQLRTGGEMDSIWKRCQSL